MRRRSFLFRCLAGVCALAPAFLHAQLPLRREQQEVFLRTARIVKRQPTTKGITQSLRLTLTDGRITHDAHLQTINIASNNFRTERGVELGFKDSYKFNIAAYRLDKLLGLGMVPVSVERVIGGSHGAVTWWVDDVLGDETDRRKGKFRAPDVEAFNRQVLTQRVFTQLVFNSDANLGNFLTDKNYDLWMIDFTRAFRILPKLTAPRDLVACDRKLLAALKTLTMEALTRELGDYCTKPELTAVLARRDLILKTFDGLLASKGSAALFDMNRASSE